MKIRILHTNDIHSRFEEFAKVVSKIRELKTENMVVLDAGDFNDFSRMELQGTKGRIGCSLLNLGGYDAIAIGNNEGFSGVENIETMTEANLIPFLSCNLYKNTSTAIKGVKRSVILTKAGVRILIIGVTPRFNEFFQLENMYATDPYEEIIKELQLSEGTYDICILLSHLGIKEDLKIAERLPEAIIIGGHSHTLMEEATKVNNVIIHQSGQYGEHLGVLDIELVDKKITSFSAENINVKDISPDEAVIKEILIQKEIASDKLSVPLYRIHKDVWHDVVEENPLTNLIADGLRASIPCDIAIINSGITCGGVKKGNISKKKLLELSPSPLNPTYVEIRGSEIKKALKQSLQAEHCLQEGRGAGFRGRYLGRLHVSGAKIEHDDKEIIKVLLENGEMEDDRVYRVSTSDYLQRGTGYPSLASDINIKYNREYIRDTIETYLKDVDYVDKCFEDRWINTNKNYL